MHQDYVNDENSGENETEDYIGKNQHKDSNEEDQHKDNNEEDQPIDNNKKLLYNHYSKAGVDEEKQKKNKKKQAAKQAKMTKQQQEEEEEEEKEEDNYKFTKINAVKWNLCMQTYYILVTFSDGTSGNNTHQTVIKDCKELDYMNVLTDYLKANNINLQKPPKRTPKKKKTTNFKVTVLPTRPQKSHQFL
eukprot:15285846-Ditylum_brightwellii.AAC.1